MTESDKKNSDWHGPYVLEAVYIKTENKGGKRLRYLCLKFREKEQKDLKRRLWEDAQAREGVQDDPDYPIVLKAKSLIGCKVKTTTWHPEDFRPDEWWDDICKAD